MFIKWCLEKKNERLRYPGSYWSSQIKSAEEILEFFKEISIGINGEKAFKVRLEDINTVIIMPLEGSKIISVANIPDTHTWDGKSEALIIKPKRKFKKQFPQTLIIKRFFKPVI